MATKSLRALIKASGNAGTSGQSFRNHVTGAVSGCRMSDYNLYGWQNWASSDFVSTSNYNSGTTFHFTYDFTMGSYFPQIRGNRPWRVSTGDVDPLGSGSLSAIAYGSNNTGNSLAITCNGVAQNPSSISLYRNWFLDFSGTGVTNGEMPPDNADYTWQIAMQQNSPNPNIYDAITYTIIFDTDPGNFNDALTYAFTANIKRVTGSTNFTVEWHDNSSYTNVVYTGMEIEFTAGASNYRGDFWVRYAAPGNGWTNYGQIHWYDPRFSSN